MFVTSDIFDLKQIGRFRGFDWQENLLGGIDIHGTDWPGYQAGALFLFEAAKRCGLVHEMRYASYSRDEERRSRSISPKSFGRLIQGELAGAKFADSVLLRGEREAIGSYRDGLIFGGEAGAIRSRRGYPRPIPMARPPWQFQADFIFPLDQDPIKVATDLFQLAVDILGAEYGYYFVRDDLCGAPSYPYGICAPLDYKALSNDDQEEVSGWYVFAREGNLWSGKWPLLRDLFQVNLLSKRHTAEPVDGLGYITEWISAQPGRGLLQDIGQDRLLWILTDAEMFNVRPLLNQAGLLLSCRDRVYRDLPDAQ